MNNTEKDNQDIIDKEKQEKITIGQERLKVWKTIRHIQKKEEEKRKNYL